jgi:hypothetical protein
MQKQPCATIKKEGEKREEAAASNAAAAMQKS